jgi:PAS domain S-box-containing protein/putative nucleotidyltransferase with HDIG domain
MAGSLSYVNPAFVRLWGYGSPAEILGRSVVEFWRMGDKVKEIVETVRAKGGWSGDLVAHRKDGVLFDVHVSSSLVVDATGQPICMQASFEDITERKRAQDALRDSEARYRTLFEHSADGILIADLETKVFKYANPAVCRMLGYTAEEMRTIGVADIHPKDALPRVVTEFEAQTRGEKALATDLPCLRKDGTILYADVNATTAAIDGRPCLVGFFRDTTGRKRMQEALIRSLEATLSVLSLTAEMRDPYTAGHQRRVTELAIALARKLGFPHDECDTLRIAGLLHDIGKLGIPAEILSKPSVLSPIEFELIRTHPQVAYEILADAAFPNLVAEIVLQHHERLDGSGYPRRISGDDILIEARILGVADVVEAMASHRPYRPALGIEAALTEIRAGRGTRYDQQVVDACAALFESGEFSFSPTSGSSQS